MALTLEQQRALAMAAARLRMQQEAPPEAPPRPSAAAAAIQGDAISQGARGFNDGSGFFSNLLAGAGKAVADTGTGLKQLGAQGLNLISPNMVSDQTVAGIQTEVDEAKARDAPLMSTGGGFTGNVAGNIGMMVLPGGALKQIPATAKVAQALLAPKTFKGAAALGAGAGAIAPVASDEDRVQNMAVGGAGGVAGHAIPKVAGAILGGNQRPNVQKLLDEGVKLTPGQIVGGAVQRVEEGATSVPLLGDAIRSSMKNANESYNTAALNRALAPIGEKAEKVGRQGVEEVETKLGTFYDNVLSKITVKLDQTFQADLKAIRQAQANLPDEQTRQLNKIISNEINKKFSGGVMTGEGMKKVESELGRLERGYRGDASFANRDLSGAIQDVRSALRELVLRGNPAQAPELKKANQGWANFVRVQRAASGVGAHEGVFTPSQLHGSVRANDPSLRKGSFGKGGALMEDLTDAGVDVMRKNVPDSGTPFRTMLGALGLGAGGLVSPGAAIGAGAGIAAYTPPMQAVMRALLARRPEFMKRAGKGVASGAPYGAIPGAAVAQALAEQEQ